MNMTKEEVLQIARQVAEDERWPWDEPVLVQEQTRGFWNRRKVWEVRTNTKLIGRNVFLEIDAETGDVISKGFCPR